MDLYRTKLLIVMLAYGMILGGLVGALLYYLFPEWMPHWFGAIFAFFIIVESLIVVLVEWVSRKSTQKQLLNTYLLTKVLKIIASIGFMTVYYIVMGKEGLRSFVLIFILFYILFLIAETLMFMSIEKRLKKMKKE